MDKRKLKEKFLKKAKLIHGESYDYSKVDYVNCHVKIYLKCNKCNENFMQLPSNHLAGYGCKFCAINDLRINKTTFMERSFSVHGEKYDYSNSIFITTSSKIEILCKNCKQIFWQVAADHMNGHGCWECNSKECGKKRAKNSIDFIIAAKNIHGNLYDYSKVNYFSNKIKVEIICNLHGSFWQRPDGHLFQKSGCFACKSMNAVKNFGNIKNSSNLEKEWLKNLNILSDYHQKILIIDNINYSVDAYIPETNTIYEFFGDFWHGNISLPKFASNKINKRNKKTFGELNLETTKRLEIFKKFGYNVVYIWENDFLLERKKHGS